MRRSVQTRGFALAVAAGLALASCRATNEPSVRTVVHDDGTRELVIRPLATGETGLVVRAGKIVTCDAADTLLAPGVLVVRNGKIEALGETCDVPDGFTVLEFPDATLAPGLVDLHTHIHSGSFGDINDMVLPVNPEFRTSPTIVPGNRLIRRGLSGGVTTLFGIPGSGTSMSGFGVLYKSKLDSTYEEAVMADPGGLKVAQDSNPQREAGDFGVGRGALSWILQNVNDRAKAAVRDGQVEPGLANLAKVHTKELPILIHTAGSDGITNTARMWRVTNDTRSTLSHGCFDAWKTSKAVIDIGMTVNNGPRTIEWVSSREGRVIGISAEYLKNGAKNLSMNTDSPVVAQEELALQSAMSSRYGADDYTMLRALTIHPAIAFGIDDRVGSLEPGKDADLVVWSGWPLDPRSRVELAVIDGGIEYDRTRDGQIF
ncbi:MAG: amidohydrolase family protein [Planctomycetes bacterium]|nr:amidohydrolase family protein [Planctomycetota bacterium]